MNDEKTESKDAVSICSIKGMRKIVFEKAHKKSKEYEDAGNILMPDDWKKMLSKAWVEVTEEIAKTCNQPGKPEWQESTEERFMGQEDQEPTVLEDVSSDEVSEKIRKDDKNT